MFDFIKRAFARPEPERPADELSLALIDKSFSILRGDGRWELEEITYKQTDYDDFFLYEKWDGPCYRKDSDRFFIGIADRCKENAGFVYVVAPDCHRRIYCPELAEAVADVCAYEEWRRRDELVRAVAAL